MIKEHPIKIVSHVSAEVAGGFHNKLELERMLCDKAQQARIDCYRRSHPRAPNRDIMLAVASAEVDVFMTTEKLGEITKFRFFIREEATK